MHSCNNDDGDNIVHAILFCHKIRTSQAIACKSSWWPY